MLFMGQEFLEDKPWSDNFELDRPLLLHWAGLDAGDRQMLDGTESLGMAGLLKVKGKQGAYKVYRVRPGEAKVAN